MTPAPIANPVTAGTSTSVVVRSPSPSGPPTSASALHLRRQLGIPTDRPIVMSGHQAEWWHPGILAKLLAARAIADRAHGSVVWVVVDQDDNDPGMVPVPVIRDAATVTTVDHRLAPAHNAATGWRPPLADVALPETGSLAAGSVASGLDRIRAAMRTRSTEPTLARQIGFAALDLAAELVAPDHVIFASQLASTDAWAEMVGAMARDPEACSRAYNDPAVRLGPEGIRPLEADPAKSRWELPLWSIDARGARTRVWSDAPALRDPSSVMPRALAMTALVRTGACDLFIHGTGGATYDGVTDQWIPKWLGAPLAPTGVATATLRLPLDRFAVDADVAHRATTEAHRVRHDPAAFGDVDAASRKADLVQRIAADRAHGRDARAGYAELQSLLADYRRRHAAEIARAAEAGASARDAYRRSRRTILARDWPFPYYDSASLAGLARAVSGAEAARFGDSRNRPVSA